MIWSQTTVVQIAAMLFPGCFIRRLPSTRILLTKIRKKYEKNQIAGRLSKKSHFFFRILSNNIQVLGELSEKKRDHDGMFAIRTIDIQCLRAYQKLNAIIIMDI